MLITLCCHLVMLTSKHKTAMYPFERSPWLHGWTRRTLSVDPLGPMSLCLLFTNRSLVLTSVPILVMSHAMSSSKIRTAWRWKTEENINQMKILVLVSFFGVSIEFWLFFYTIRIIVGSSTMNWWTREHVYLLKWHTSGQQLDEVPCPYNGIRVKGLFGGANRDAALDQIQGGLDVLLMRKKSIALMFWTI